jgi:hypothetical protein
VTRTATYPAATHVSSGSGSGPTWPFQSNASRGQQLLPRAATAPAARHGDGGQRIVQHRPALLDRLGGGPVLGERLVGALLPVGDDGRLGPLLVAQVEQIGLLLLEVAPRRAVRGVPDQVVQFV